MSRWSASDYAGSVVGFGVICLVEAIQWADRHPALFTFGCGLALGLGFALWL